MKSWAGSLLLIVLLDVTSFAQTSATFAIGDGGGMSFETNGAAAAALAVGYAKVNPNPGAQTPSGLAVIGFRQNNFRDEAQCFGDSVTLCDVSRWCGR